MVSFFTVMVVFAAIMGGFYLYLKFKNKDTTEKVIVCYYEKIGNNVIESDIQYEGLIFRAKDLFKVPKKKIMMPVPPRNALVPTMSGGKKIHIIKFSYARYGYFVPNLSNTVYTEKRDQKGNIIYNVDGNPIIIKHKWQFSPDVLEPEIMGWSDNMSKEIRAKHASMLDSMMKWILPVGIVIMFVFGIITLQITTKSVQADKAEILRYAQQREEQADKITQGLNTLMDKVSGQRTLENENPDE